LSSGIPLDFDPGDLRPPARWEILREARVVFEWAGAKMRFKRLVESAPRGDREPVMVVPGFGADDSWTALLRGFLEAVGYDAVGWGLGRNHGNVPKLVPKLLDRAGRLADEHGRAIRLVGWSLGGYLSREVARERPAVVDRVITLGAPIVGGPSFTFTASAYRRRGYDLEEIRATVLRREQRPIQVPVFAIYSRSDGVVSWRACIDTFRNPRVVHHEVASTHLGLIVSSRVLGLVADLLACSIAPR
jgi:pimeloyl-ACP methyl ester carboxylesterase